jgi:hypothetical protein
MKSVARTQVAGRSGLTDDRTSTHSVKGLEGLAFTAGSDSRPASQP